MTVLIRKLLLAFLGLSLFNTVINIVFFHSVQGTLAWVGMLAVDALTLCISYSMSKKALLTLLVIQKAVWIVAAIMIYGWESGFQYYLIILMIVYSFGEAGYSRKKIIFNFACFVLFSIFLIFFKGSVGKIDISGVERVIQIFNTFIIFLMTGLVSFSFSRESQEDEEKIVKYNKQLEVQAAVDALTGLHNRRSTRDYINSLVEESSDLSICMCDIDFFKRINDTYGHDFGDEVLVAISKKFKEMAGNEGFVSRWGGEEFLLVFPGMNGDNAYVKVADICSQIRKMEIPYKEEIVKITVTYGLTEYDLQKTLDENIKDADEKLYMGKQSGRNRVVY